MPNHTMECRLYSDHSAYAPWLPSELTDRVIDFLYDDIQALKACKATCRAFVPRARHLQFRTVSLNSITHKRFICLLESSPDIGIYVHELKISMSATLFEGLAPKWVNELPSILAPKLPNLDTLHVHGSGGYKASPLRTFRTIKELYFTDCEVLSLNDFLALLSSLPLLESVSCRDVVIGRSTFLTMKDTDSTSVELTASTLAIRKLSFTDCRLDPPLFVDWVLSKGLHTQIESLTIVPLQKPGLTQVGRFLEIAGPSLKHIKLATVALLTQGGFSDILDVPNPGFSLAHATNLKSLEFGSPAAFALQYGADDLSFGWVSSMLGQVSSHAIEHIGFSLCHGDLKAVRSPDWDAIARLLSSAKFSSVKKFVFHVWGEDPIGGIIRAKLKEKLADLDKHGLLRFEATPVDTV